MDTHTKSKRVPRVGKTWIAYDEQARSGDTENASVLAAWGDDEPGMNEARVRKEIAHMFPDVAVSVYLYDVFGGELFGERLAFATEVQS